jgi:hypothetical protein
MMTDEIDLLRAYRAEVAGPSEVAWERARAAIAAASSADVPSTSRPRRRRLLYLAFSAVAAAVAVLLLVVLPGSPHLTAALHTAWQPARALPVAKAGAVPPAQQGGPAGTWRLTSFLTTEGWQLNTSGPEPGPLTCPLATVCYLEGDNATSASGPADMDTFYFSADGGRSWSALPVPNGVTFSSPLTCTSAARCAAGGVYYGKQPVFLTTADGGHSWTITPLPSGTGQIVRLSCLTALECRGLEWTSGTQLATNFDLLKTDMRFIATNDGGAHFMVTAFPAGESIESLSCPTATRCAAVGVHDGSGPVYDHARIWDFASPGMQGIVLTTQDGGLSWQPGAFPANAGAGPFPDITCPDATHCWLIDAVGSGEAGSNANRSQVGVSSDGGKTWTTQPVPGRYFPQFVTLTCPTAVTCYAPSELSKAIPGLITATLSVTHDAGRTWSLVTFSRPSKVPAGMAGDSFMAIGSIQCPAPNACLALGVVDQGQRITPVYTTGGSP